MTRLMRAHSALSLARRSGLRQHEDLNDLPIAIVALDDDGGRPLTGQHHMEMCDCAACLLAASTLLTLRARSTILPPPRRRPR